MIRRPTRPSPRPVRADGGSVSLELVIAFPAVLLLIFGVVQGALYFHARNVALAAAQEGLREARVENGTAAAGGSRAREFIDAAGGEGVLRSVQVTPTRTPTQASITVTGAPMSVVPGWTLNVSQTATGPVERVTTP